MTCVSEYVRIHVMSEVDAPALKSVAVAAGLHYSADGSSTKVVLDLC